MKLILAAALAIIATPATAETQKFEISGFDPETLGDACKAERDFIKCYVSKGKIGELKSQMIAANFFNGEMTWAYGILDGFMFFPLFENFNKDYGPPRIEAREWKNKEGKIRKNSVAIWTFENGTLELSMIGSTEGTTDFEFRSNSSAKISR